MKELCCIKSGAYKVSKDYARLRELLDAGHYVVCFIHYSLPGTQYEFQDICIANKRVYGYEFCSRGICYLSIYEEFTDDVFNELCEDSVVEFIEPSNI